MKKIAVVGAGRIGTAFGNIFKSKGYETALWDKREGRVENQKTIEEIVSNAEAVFLCVPSWALREVCEKLSEYIPKKAAVISMAKGIEEKTRKTPDEILGEFFSRKRIGIIGGPMLAEELNLNKAGVGVIGSGSPSLGFLVMELFEGSQVKIFYSKDIRGVALGGILKNVYALAFGIADGLGWSGNAKGWLIAQSMDEISRIALLLGGRKKTVFGAACLGDLATCGFSEYSRNRKAGQDVLRDGKFDIKSEGVVSAPSLFILVGKKMRGFKILSSLERIMLERKNPKEVFRNLLSGA